MNADRLLALYEKVAEAPDAVSRLRRFVLDLAVRGKLVPQEAGDEPASELLTTITSERNERVKRREIKRAAPFEPVEDTPFEAPAGWEWIPLGDTGNIFSGNSINATTREQLEKTDEGLPFIATKDVGYGLDVIDYENGLLVPSSDTRFKVARAKSVLICAEGGSAGRKIGLSDRDICFGNKLLANETWSVIVPEFVRVVYMSDFFFGEFAARMTGVIGGISIKNFLQLPIPLPPLTEQRRIVAKVEELMALLDRMEAARQQREATRDRLTVASLARLTAPDADAADLPANVRFALATVPALTTRHDQIKPLRQTILNLAVRGKLVKQDPTDEPVSSLVEQLQCEKKAAKKRSVEPDLTLVDFSIPSHWIWQSLDAMLTVGPQNGLSPRKSERTDAPKAITLTATTSGTFDGRHFKNVEVSTADAARYWLEPGDLLFQRGNTRDYVGMAAIYDGPSEEFLFPDLIMRVKISRQVDIRFVHLWCISPFARHFLSSNATGAQQTMPKINQGILRSLPVPLPPLAEQHRIVAKVDALMALCDRLEAALTARETTRARLLEALLADALNPASMQEMETAE